MAGKRLLEESFLEGGARFFLEGRDRGAKKSGVEGQNGWILGARLIVQARLSTGA